MRRFLTFRTLPAALGLVNSFVWWMLKQLFNLIQSYACFQVFSKMDLLWIFSVQLSYIADHFLECLVHKFFFWPPPRSRSLPISSCVHFLDRKWV